MEVQSSSNSTATQAKLPSKTTSFGSLKPTGRPSPRSFYTWLKEKHPEIPIEGKRSEDYVATTRHRCHRFDWVAPSTKRNGWNDLIQSAVPFFEARSQLAPSSLDLRTTKAVVDNETESTNEVKRLSESTRVVFGDQQAWLSKTARRQERSQSVAPGFAFEAIRQSGSLDRRGKVVESEADRKQLRESIAKELRDIQLTGDLIAALDQLNPADGSMEVVSLTNLGDFIVLEVATSKTQKARFASTVARICSSSNRISCTRRRLIELEIRI